jgi:ubiquinone/menaquinone biosynthesis C-methylase UbiE/DNA-binding transcriptional ArsR family regulator
MTAAADQVDSFIAITKAAADPLRRDVLKLLQQDSFGVLELCHILSIAQPALSHHLKLLHQSGLLTRRRDGNTVFYRRALQSPDFPLGEYVESMFRAIDAAPLRTALAARVDDVYAERAARSRKFFSDHAERFAAQQALISAPDVYLPAVAEVVSQSPAPRTRALDVGTGDGAALGLLAERFTDVVGIDESRSMLERAAARLRAGQPGNVTLRHGDFTSLRSERFDAILFSMVLHHARAPGDFFAHAARLLNRGGLLLVIELCAHDQDWVREACGDVWLGFAPRDLDRWAADAQLVGGAGQYLAQRNGFRLQIKPFFKGATDVPTGL